MRVRIDSPVLADATKPDHMARVIAMASYLYYNHDVSMMADSDFDKLCQRCADKWAWLSPLRKFMLVHPRDIRSTGSGIRMTAYAEGASLAWLLRNTNHQPNENGFLKKWRFSERHQLHWSYL